MTNMITKNIPVTSERYDIKSILFDREGEDYIMIVESDGGPKRRYHMKYIRDEI